MRPKGQSTVAIVFMGFGALLGILGLTWVFQGNDFFLTRFFAPKYEQVRRETFENSKAYRDGMVQELRARRWRCI